MAVNTATRTQHFITFHRRELTSMPRRPLAVDDGSGEILGYTTDDDRENNKYTTDDDAADTSQTSSSATTSHILKQLASKSPTRLLQFFRWLQGPGRYSPLPRPKPWLHLTLTFQNRVRTYALEPIVIRATRHFTSPILLGILMVAYIISLSFFARAQVLIRYDYSPHCAAIH